MSNLSTGPGPQNAPEPSHGQPDTAGLNGTTRSGDQAPVPPLDRAPWLFQKGNTYGQMRKHHKGRMEKYIQEQTMSGALIGEFFLTVASGQPFPMKRTVRLSLTLEQWAVARGTATPEQRAIAEKQPRFIVVEELYYPTVRDMMEAMHWLADRGFGTAPQTVPIESDQPAGFRMVFRKWAPGTDPAAQGPPPGGSSNDERAVRRPWLPPDLQDIG